MPEKKPTTVGKFISRWRGGMTQAALGALVDRPQSTISAWENGQNDISRADFVRIATALRIPETSWPEAMRLPHREPEAA